VHGGLEACACRVATERVALLRSARLPWTPFPAPLPPTAAAWFATCRPEDGQPWLTVAGAGPGAVAAALARLVCAAGIPVDTGRDPAAWRRVVAVLDGDALDAGTAERLLDACVVRGTTLVLACARAPFADGGGVERAIGDRAAAALWDRGVVVKIGRAHV
jgi:hypothetical protein